MMRTGSSARWSRPASLKTIAARRPPISRVVIALTRFTLRARAISAGLEIVWSVMANSKNNSPAHDRSYILSKPCAPQRLALPQTAYFTPVSRRVRRRSCVSGVSFAPPKVR